MAATMMTKLDEAKKAIQKRCPNFPRYLIVLGSGLAGLLNDLEREVEIPFTDIPGIKPPTVEGHVGRLVVGKLGGVRVACMQGRLHFYEGHSMEDVVFPYRAFALCGAERFILTNAAGGLHPEMKPMDLLLMTDHINLMGTNPLIGKNESVLGPRFPDMTTIYDKNLRECFKRAAASLSMKLHEGVYVAIHGPSYETPAEIRMYRSLGADVVGMSTVPEAIAIRHMGKSIVGVSCITNLAAGVGPDPLVHDEVLDNAKKIYASFASLMTTAVKEMERGA